MNVKIINFSRIKDYRSVLGNTVTIVSGYDEKFAFDDSETSLVMKTLQAGQGYIIEDTTLTINEKVYGSAVKRTDIIGLERAVWTTKMTYHSGAIIHFYEGSLSGHIKFDLPESAGALKFGEIFIPDGYALNICEIEERGDVDFTNARQLALTKMLLGESYHVEMVETILQTKSTTDPATAHAALNPRK